MRDIKTDLVCFGELIWDMLPAGKLAGGAPFNIVNRATALGLTSELIASLGNDPPGDEFMTLIRNLGNSVRYIQRHPSLPTSMALVEFGPDGEPQYEIVHPVAWDDIWIDAEMIDLIKNSRSFVYSSLAIRDARSREALFQLLPHANLKICDVNLRAGHYTRDTILRMIKSADVLRMNEAELATISEWLNTSSLDLKSQIKSLAEQFNYQFVIVTLGGDGAICYKDNDWYEQPVFKVKVVDTVGSGDAFLASFIYQYLQGSSIPISLRYACAVGALTASKSGGTPVISSEEIASMMAITQ